VRSTVRGNPTVVGVSAVLGLAIAAALAVTGTADGAVTGTGPLEPPLGACTGPACPSAYPPPNNGDFTGRDASINVFVGADYLARQRAAEVEGKVVTLGNLTVDKSGGGSFNMAVVGVGSRVPPPNGTDFVVVGGDVRSEPGNTVLVGGSDVFGAAYGDLRHGGTLTGTVDVVAPGRKLRDPAAAEPYRHLRRVIEERSHCAAEAKATGTVTVTASEATFAGDGSSPLQVFDVPGDLGRVGHQIGLVFTGIPAGATVLVNLRSEHPVISTYTGTGQPGDQLTELRPKLMWNFPTAATATITGGAQFQGSVLAGNPAGVTTLSSPGMNGRVYLAGGLVQEGSGGYELHAYDFTGDLPVCDTTSEPSGSATPTTTPSHSTGPHPSGSASTEPGHSHHPGPSKSPGGQLANTGADATGLLVGLPAAVLLTGLGGLLWRGRRRGRHS